MSWDNNKHQVGFVNCVHFCRKGPVNQLNRDHQPIFSNLSISPQVSLSLPEYGVLFYRVVHEKRPVEGEIILGVFAKGIIVYDVKDGRRSTSQTFFWRETSTISSNVSRKCLFFYKNICRKQNTIWFWHNIRSSMTTNMTTRHICLFWEFEVELMLMMFLF